MNPNQSAIDSDMQTYEIIAAAIDRRQGGPGVRPMARALGITEASTYRQGREPLSDEDPDATGAFNFLDRLEAVVRMLGTYPNARWILLRLDAWWRSLMDQVLHRKEVDCSDHARLATLCDLARANGEAMGECLDGEANWDADLVAALKGRDVYDQLVRILENRADHQTETVAMRRVG